MMRRILLVAAALLVSACKSRPGLDDVRVAFKATHPGYEVVSVEFGELKEPATSYRIKYRRPGETQVRSELWTYEPEKKAETSPPKDSTAKATPAT